MSCAVRYITAAEIAGAFNKLSHNQYYSNRNEALLLKQAAVPAKAAAYTQTMEKHFNGLSDVEALKRAFVMGLQVGLEIGDCTSLIGEDDGAAF